MQIIGWVIHGDQFGVEDIKWKGGNMILNDAKVYTAYIMAGSYLGSPYFMVGSGTTAVQSSDTTLEHPRDRQLFTSRNSPDLRKVAFIADWSASEISGTILSEFGLCASGTALTGSMWSRSVLTPITFNGINELRIEENWEYY